MGTQLHPGIGPSARYTDVERQRLLDGVEEIARGGTGETGSPEALTRAFEVLGDILIDSISVPEDREVPERAFRIHEQSENGVSKGLAVGLLTRDVLPRYPEWKSRIEDLLFSLASASRGENLVPPATAFMCLDDIGELGIPVLRRLYEEDVVKDPRMRADLAELAARGFRLRGGGGRLELE